jgi:peptidoglycan/LPS O-acetylase OafA/YrhL
LLLYFSSFKEHEKFYLIPFRFFELSLGGIAAICLQNKLIIHRFSAIFVLGLAFILCINLSFMPSQLLLLVTIILTIGILVSSNEASKISSFILENKITVSIGLISFSLYMWHQVLLSYARYFVKQKLETFDFFYLFVLTVLLSAATYYFVEQPFRDKKRIKTSVLLSVLILFFLVTNLSALYIYEKG